MPSGAAPRRMRSGGGCARCNTSRPLLPSPVSGRTLTAVIPIGANVSVRRISPRRYTWRRSLEVCVSHDVIVITVTILLGNPPSPGSHTRYDSHWCHARFTPKGPCLILV